jgi:hypothetical protein
MGYESRVSGQIEIHPPLNWTEYQQAGDYRYKAHGGSEHTWLRLPLVEAEPVETPEGTLVRKTVTHVEPNLSHFKLKNAEDGVESDLERIVDMFGDKHSFTGYLLRVGDNLGDVQRFWVENGAVHSERAKPMVWPDGSKVEEV